MQGALDATNESISHRCSSPGAQTPVYLQVAISGTFSATLSLQVKDMYADDTAYVTVTTYTTATRADLLVAGQKEYRLIAGTYTSGTANVELISTL